MEKLNQKHMKLVRALETLNRALDNFAELKESKKGYNPHMTYEEEYKTYRDSLIQRFEYTIDLFWKYLKCYLAIVNLLPDVKIPRDVICRAHEESVLEEVEAEKVLEMLKSRNLTSHVYIEEVAEHLADLIPGYYSVMESVVNRLVPKNNPV